MPVSAKRYVADYLCITLRQLTEWVRLDHVSASETIGYERGGLPPFIIDISWYPISSQLVFKYHDGWREVTQSIRVTQIHTEVASRKYLLCPVTTQRCASLYLVDGQFGSREAFGLVYLRTSGGRTTHQINQMHATIDRLSGADGRGPARGAHRRKLVAKLQKLDTQSAERWGGSALPPEGADLLPQIPDLTELIRADLRRRRRLAARLNGLDTQSALDRAKLSYAGHVEATLERVEADMAASSLCDQRLKIFSGPVAISEDHARLDIRVLVRAGLFRVGEKTGFLLDWAETPAAIDAVHGFVDLIDYAKPRLLLEHIHQGECSYQELRLVRTGEAGPSWKAVCPVRREGVYVLAFRAGRFASREGQRLVNRSQRKAPKPS